MSTPSTRPRSCAPPIAAAPELRQAMLEVEIFGEDLAPDAPPPAQVRRLCALAAAAVGIEDGHLAIEYVDEQRIAQLNAEHRGKEGPTDVLSFPIDGAALHGGVTPHDGVTEHGGPEWELGDVVICPEHTLDLCEAIVHGVLHLVGLDHETDSGEMLALQAELLADWRSR
jgi:probable rRNA maturation factor